VKINKFYVGWILSALGLGSALAPVFDLVTANTVIMTAGTILFIIGMIMVFASIGFFDSKS
jgi:multisubunit Na+/H+ antiporter MnhG subunit